jgi:hypothetical protein
MRYWIPYKWSKNRLAKFITSIIKPWKRLVDLFGWWWSITHYASTLNKRQYIHYNELDKSIYELFTNIHELLKDIEDIKKRWISREDFFSIKKNKTKRL